MKIITGVIIFSTAITSLAQSTQQQSIEEREPDLLFNALSLDMSNSDRENDKYYISNINITKE